MFERITNNNNNYLISYLHSVEWISTNLLLGELLARVDIRILGAFERSLQFFQLFSAESRTGTTLLAFQGDPRLWLDIRQVTVTRRSRIYFSKTKKIKSKNCLDSNVLWVVKVGNRRLSLAGQHIFIRVIFFFPSKQSDIRIYNKKPLFSETNGKQAKPERKRERKRHLGPFLFQHLCPQTTACC